MCYCWLLCCLVAFLLRRASSRLVAHMHWHPPRLPLPALWLCQWEEVTKVEAKGKARSKAQSARGIRWV